MHIKSFWMAAGLMAVGIAGFAQDVPADHLLLSEISINPVFQSGTNGYAEYVEIYNPTDAAIDLTNYYITDLATYYDYPAYVGEGIEPDMGGSDYISQFPAGTSIPAGGVVVVTTEQDTFLHGFFGETADLSDYTSLPGSPQLFETTDTDANSANDMISHNANEAGAGNFSKTNNGEFVALIYWDGLSDLVQDVDIISWGSVPPGDANGLQKKSPAIEVDGPDAGGELTPYLTDNGVETRNTDVEPSYDPNTLRRRTIIEIGEQGSVGNGINGQDETMEWNWDTWGTTEDNAAGQPGANPGTTDLVQASANPEPFIGAVTRSILDPVPGSTFVIQCRAGGVTAPTVKLFLDSGSGFGAGVAMSYNASSQFYEATVGPYPDKTALKYYFEATTGADTFRMPITSGHLFFEFSNTFYTVHIRNTPVQPADILINEVQYNPAGTDNSTRSEYTELFNTTAEPIDISGWSYADNSSGVPEDNLIPFGTILPANGYIVLVANKGLFLSQPEYASVDPNIVIDMVDRRSGAAPGLNNGGDDPGISRANDYRWLNRPAAVFTSITYTDASPWPAGQNNSGVSIELKAPILDPTQGENWAYSILPYGSPGAANQQSGITDWSIF